MMYEPKNFSATSEGGACFSCDLSALPQPLKRMLRMQMREFIHYLEDAEDGLSITYEVIRMGFSSRAFVSSAVA